jgi:plastocyanin
MSLRATFALLIWATGIVMSATAIGCGGSSSTTLPSSPSPTSSPTPATGAANVSIVSGASTLTTTAYAPNPVTVTVGGTVTWMNNDTKTHTSTANDRGWDSGPIAPGHQFSRTFPSAGTFQYFCTVHPGMVGTVTVQ